MLTTEQINQIRAKSGLPPKESVANNGNYVGKYDYLKPQEKRTGVFGDLGSDIRQTGSNLKETFNRTQSKIQSIANAEQAGEQGKLRSFGQAFGTVAGGVSRSIGDVLMGAVKSVLPQAREEDLKEGVVKMIEKISPTAVKIDNALGRPVGSTIEAYNNLPEQSKRDVNALLGISELALDLTGAGFVKKAGQQGVKTGIKAGTKLAEGTAEQSRRLISAGESALAKGKQALSDVKVPELIKPSPKPLKAAGQILQGKADDVAEGIRSLSLIDTTGVKTFKELGGKISSKIKNLAQKVDADLALDTSKKILDDLVLTAKTNAGKVIKIRPVKNALSQLDELYTKIGDVVKQSEIRDLITKARQEGLTKLEINNLAREYGQEFGSKAFSKMGDALTSVNAKLFENTRSQLKQLARQGITGKAAQTADQAMSKLYNTQRLVQKNVEAVNKIQQKINGRGLFEKIGNTVAKYGDLLTGGSIRGLVGGLLPRGAGYKVMNALDIEEVLGRNLKIINNAIKSGSDKEIIDILKGLEKPLPKGKGEILKSTTLKSKPTPIEEFKNFKRDLTLQGQDKIIQEKSIEKFIKNKQKLVDEYIKDNGLVANTDNARKLFSDVGYTGGNSAAVHEASSALNKLVWKKTLKLAKNLEAILFSGGSGSGKSSVAEQFIRGLKKGNSAVLDSNLSGYNSAVASIAETLKAKKVARIVYIYREPVDAFIGTIKRMLTNPKEGGRLVPIKITAGNHPDSLGVVKKIYEEYGDLIAKKKLKFTFINNSNGAGKAVKMDYNKVKNIKLPNDLESQMKKALDKIYKDGVIIKGKKYKITKEQYNQLIK